MKQKILSALVAAFTVMLLLCPDIVTKSVQEAMQLCANALVPALFPFFVCSSLLLQLGVITRLCKKLSGFMSPVFNLSGAAALPLIMGIVGGYPVGAQMTAELVKSDNLPRGEGERLLAFCNNSGPVFVLGAVGSGMLQNPRLGACIYAAHLAATLSVAMLMRGKKGGVSYSELSPVKTESLSFGELFGACVGDAAENTIKICGYVMIFKTFAAILEKYISSPHAMLVVYGLLEPSGACAAASQLLTKTPVLMCCAISAIIGWSGVSVHMQVLGITEKVKLRPKKYFCGKCIMTLISPIYAYIIVSVFGGKISAAPHLIPPLYMHAFGIGIAVLSLLVTVVCVSVAAAFFRKNANL